MGTIKHDTVIITGEDYTEVDTAYKKAIELFIENFDENQYIDPEKIVSPIIRGLANDQYSFFLAPDGSKEGWETSDIADEVREVFLNYLDTTSLDYVHIKFGGDTNKTTVERFK